MFGVGPWEILWLAFIAAVIFGAFAGRFRGGLRSYGPTLVLKEFTVAESPTEGTLFKLVGRPSGLFGWFFSILGIDSVTNLTVSNRELSLQSASLSGEVQRLAPLACIASTNCGFLKPIFLLVMSVLFVLLGLVGFGVSRGGSGILLFGLIIALVFFALYSLNKKIVISIETTGGSFMGISFKRSIIENVPVDFEKARQAILALNKHIVDTRIR